MMEEAQLACFASFAPWCLLGSRGGTLQLPWKLACQAGSSWVKQEIFIPQSSLSNSLSVKVQWKYFPTLLAYSSQTQRISMPSYKMLWPGCRPGQLLTLWGMAWCLGTVFKFWQRQVRGTWKEISSFPTTIIPHPLIFLQLTVLCISILANIS